MFIVVRQDAAFFSGAVGALVDAMRECGIDFEFARGEAELEVKLAHQRCGGSMHIVANDPGVVSPVVERALSFPDRLHLVAGTAPDLVDGFLSGLKQEEVELLIVIAGAENPSMEIRVRTAPRWYREAERQLRDALVPDLMDLSEIQRSLLMDLFTLPLGGVGSAAKSLSKKQQADLKPLLRERGLVAPAKIRQALFALLAHVHAHCGLTVPHAMALRGRSAVTSARDRIQDVLHESRSEGLRAISDEEAWMRVNGFVRTRPAILNTNLLHAGPAQFVREWMVAEREREIEAGDASLPWLRNDVLESVKKEHGGTVLRLLTPWFHLGAGLQDAEQIAWIRIGHDLAKFLVEDENGARLTLTGKALEEQIMTSVYKDLPNEKARRKLMQSRLESVGTADEEQELVPPARSDPLAELIMKERLETVQRILSEMDSQRDAAIFTAVVVRGEFQGDVAERYGLGQSTVSEIVARVRRHVISELLRKGFDSGG